MVEAAAVGVYPHLRMLGSRTIVQDRSRTQPVFSFSISLVGTAHTRTHSMSEFRASIFASSSYQPLR